MKRLPKTLLVNRMRTSLEMGARLGCFLATICLFFCAALAASAAPRLVVGTVLGFPGQTVEVPISLRYGTNDLLNVVALQADILFDETGLSSSTPTGGDALSNHSVASSLPGTGVRRLLVYAPNNTALTNGVVASLPFTVAPDALQNFSLTLTNVILATAEGAVVPSTNVSGAIAVNPVYVRPDGDVEGYLFVSSNTPPDQCFIIQATTDFVTWVNVFTNTATTNILLFLDSGADAFPYRFYRGISCPEEPVPMRAAARLVGPPANEIHIQFEGLTNLLYTVQASTNLFDWQDLATVTAAGGQATYTNQIDGTYRYRFFRLKSP